MSKNKKNYTDNRRPGGRHERKHFPRHRRTLDEIPQLKRDQRARIDELLAKVARESEGSGASNAQSGGSAGSPDSNASAYYTVFENPSPVNRTGEVLGKHRIPESIQRSARPERL